MRRKQLLLIFCLLACCHGKAQQRVTYSYDASGNRVERYVVTTQTKAKSKPTGVNNTGFGNVDVNVYANSVSDNLTITFGQIPSEGIECLVYDYGGVVVYKNTLHDAKTVIDISGWSTGVYLLHIRGADKSKTWKIVKK